MPTDLAEGWGRFGEREVAHVVSIASGSASEAEYPLTLARDLGYEPTEWHERLDADVNEIQRMLRALHARPTANR